MEQKLGQAIIYTEWGDLKETDTFNCCHCQITVHVHFGSGKKRGYCPMCNAPTCGEKHCLECVPFMKKIEESENRHRLRKTLDKGYNA